MILTKLPVDEAMEIVDRIAPAEVAGDFLWQTFSQLVKGKAISLLPERVLKYLNLFQYGNQALKLCCKHGYLDLVEQLLQHEGVDPGFSQQKNDRRWGMVTESQVPLWKACESKQLAIVDRLLQDPRVDVGQRGREFVDLLTRGGALDILQLLLEKRRLPIAKDMIVYHVEFDRLEEADLLLKFLKRQREEEEEEAGAGEKKRKIEQ
jgi:hypothetical protein